VAVDFVADDEGETGNFSFAGHNSILSWVGEVEVTRLATPW
jgi:hypothetical protein